MHARTTGDIVQVFANDGQVVATHVRRLSGRSTDFAHYPPQKVAFAMRTPTWCRHTAELVGPACEAVIAEFPRQRDPPPAFGARSARAARQVRL